MEVRWLLFLGFLFWLPSIIYCNDSTQNSVDRNPPSASKLWTKGEAVANPPTPSSSHSVHEYFFKRMAKRGFHPKYIVDCGAKDGDWSTMVKHIYPDATFYLIEGNKQHKDNLLKTGSWFALTLLGEEDRIGDISEKDTSTALPKATTLDSILTNMPKIDLLKMDIDGFELSGLKGAKRILSVVDVALLHIPLVSSRKKESQSMEILSFMKTNGFELFDIAEPKRSADNIALSFDGFFIRSQSPLFKKFSFEDTLFSGL